MSTRVSSRGLKRRHLYVEYMASSESTTQGTIELAMIVEHYSETRLMKDNKEYYRKSSYCVCPDKFLSRGKHGYSKTQLEDVATLAVNREQGCTAKR